MARSGRWRSSRLFGGSVVLAVIALVLAMATAPSTAGPDPAAATGSVSGEVRAGGAPEVASYLYLYVQDGNRWTWTRSGYTGHTSAAFTFDGLPPGTYRVGVSSPDEPWVDTFHPSADLVGNAADVVVGEGEDVTGVDVDLLREGTVQGTVTDVAGAGVPDVKVVVTDADRETRIFEGVTDADGTYEVGGLTTADYVVRFKAYSAGKQSEYFRDAPTLYSATPVAVVSGQDASGTDAVLAGPTTLSGTVTDRLTGDPIPFARIDLYELQGDHWQPADIDAFADATGRYRLDNVWGTYRVLAVDSGFETHDYAFHPGVRSVEEATTVEVPAGGDTVIDVALDRLPETSVVSGTVRVGGASRGGIVVEPEILYDGYWHVMNHVTTAADGTYRTYVAVPGTYRVHFADPAGALGDRWWEGALTAPEATELPVVAGDELTGIDADLGAPVPTGALAGAVEDPDDRAIEGVEVTAYAWSEIEEAWTEVDRTRTGDDGRYLVDDLPVGTYRVGFDGLGYDWIDEFHLDSDTVDDADDVTVSADDTTAVDAELAPAPGEIAGRVTSDEGAALDDVRVELWAYADGAWAVAADTALEPTDTFRFPGLEAGATYRLGVRDTSGGHHVVFWPGAPDVDEVEEGFDVVVRPGATSFHDLTLRVVEPTETDSPTPTPSPTPTTTPTTTPTPTPTNTPTPTPTTTPSTAPTPTPTNTPTPTPTTTPSTAPTPTPTPSTVPTPTLTPTPVPAPAITHSGVPRVVGTLEVGRAVRVRRVDFSPSDVRVRYQWRADGRRIRGATKPRLVLTRSLLGSRLRVRVTAVLPGAPTVVVRTKPTARVRA